MPSFPSPEPTVSYFDDLDHFKDFENEFSAIVYNDALMSKLDFLTEPTVNPQHINELDLKNDTSLSKYDEEEQNVVYFNDLFPLNIIYPNDLKSDKDNDDDEIDIIQSSGLNVINIDTKGSNKLLETSHDRIRKIYNVRSFIMELKRDQRHPYLRFEGLEYTDADIHTFEERLERIFGRQIYRVQVLDFVGLTRELREDMDTRLRMIHSDEHGQDVFVSDAWRRLLDIRGPLVREWVLEFFSTNRFDNRILDFEALVDEIGTNVYWAESSRMVASKGDLRGYWEEILSSGDFLTTVPSYVVIRDPMDREVVNLHFLLDFYLFRHAEGRNSGAQMSEGHFIARLADHFGLLTEAGLQGLTIEAKDLTGIDLDELARLHICEELTDTWTWVAPGPERQQVTTAGAPEGVEGAHAIDEGVQAILAPVQAPQPPPAATRSIPQRIMRLEEELMDASGRTYQAFDSTLVGSSQMPYQRRTRRRTDDAITSIAQQDEQQPNP
ncbi:hypothetical protein Tco_0525724 [Tanacetum coccineum]